MKSFIHIYKDLWKVERKEYSLKSLVDVSLEEKVIWIKEEKRNVWEEKPKEVLNCKGYSIAYLNYDFVLWKLSEVKCLLDDEKFVGLSKGPKRKKTKIQNSMQWKGN